MPTYNLGSGISSAGEDIGNAIARMGIQMQKDKQDRETVQAMLDQAKQMQFNDMRTGKPKNFFSDDQLHHIQRLIDQKHYHAAGAAEAAMGIGKDMYTRIQTAAAKQADAYQKQQELARIQAQSLGGPYQMTDPTGVKYRGNIGKDGVIQWFPDTGVPKNQMGLSAKDQFEMQRGMVKDANKVQKDQFDAAMKAKAAQNTAFSGLLKGLGINSPTDLFDPSVQQGGFFSPSGGFVNASFPTTAVGDKSGSMDKLKDILPGSDISSFQQDPRFQQDITHIRFYHQPPTSPTAKDGELGKAYPMSDVINLQNVAAGMAGPQAVQALQWLRQNPTNEHADAVRQEIIKRTSEAEKAPDPATFAPTQPSFAPAAAPAQPYPQQQPTDQSQVSDEAAAQNPGY